MSFKHLFPTYLARYRWVERVLRERVGTGRLGRVLHVGTGEGDFDPMLIRFADAVDACDINPDDISFARARNASVERLTYWVQDAHALEFEDDSFDAVISVDVIEHVEDPAGLVREMGRVVRPGGFTAITVPNVDFPWTYDPLHRAVSRDRRLAGIGAYAYGHDKLVAEAQMAKWLSDAGFELEATSRMTFALAAAFECYWPGLLQRFLKSNATNDSGGGARKIALKPRSHEVPAIAMATEALNALDARLAASGAPSVGLGFVAIKSPRNTSTSRP